MGTGDTDPFTCCVLVRTGVRLKLEHKHSYLNDLDSDFQTIFLGKLMTSLTLEIIELKSR
jgi:hypothetical protein